MSENSKRSSKGEKKSEFQFFLLKSVNSAGSNSLKFLEIVKSLNSTLKKLLSFGAS